MPLAASRFRSNPQREAASGKRPIPIPLAPAAKRPYLLAIMAHIRSFSAIHYNKAKFADLSARHRPAVRRAGCGAERTAARRSIPTTSSTSICRTSRPRRRGRRKFTRSPRRRSAPWLDAGILVREKRTAFYPYMQSVRPRRADRCIAAGSSRSCELVAVRRRAGRPAREDVQGRDRGPLCADAGDAVPALADLRPVQRQGERDHAAALLRAWRGRTSPGRSTASSTTSGRCRTRNSRTASAT